MDSGNQTLEISVNYLRGLWILKLSTLPPSISFEISLCDRTQGENEFNRKAFCEFFNENPEMGNKIYKFMKYHSKRPDNKAYGIDYDAFVATGKAISIVFCIN